MTWVVFTQAGMHRHKIFRLYSALVQEDPHSWFCVVSAELYHRWYPDRLLILVLASLLSTAAGRVNGFSNSQDLTKM